MAVFILWKTNVIAVAESLIDYRESDVNYLVSNENQTQGYTRFGHWYGDTVADGAERLENGLSAYAYDEWDAMFVSYVLNYAGIYDFGFDKDAANWAVTLIESGHYADATEYVPKPGDLIFFTPCEGAWDYVGIVSGINRSFFGNEIESISVIIGDSENKVSRIEAKVRKAENGDQAYDKIHGYGVLTPESENPMDQSVVDSIPETESTVSDESSPSFDNTEIENMPPSDETTAAEAAAELGDSITTTENTAHDESMEETPEEEKPEEEKSEEGKGNSEDLSGGKAGILTANGNDYSVTMTYGVDAGIPETAKLKVTEIKQGTAEYDQYIKKAKVALGIKEEETLDLRGRFFDIKIMTKDGEYSPKAPVIVDIQYNKAITGVAEEDMSAVHFTDDGAEKVDLNADVVDEKIDGVDFEAESFSVYGVVYTVEFIYEDFEFVLCGEHEISVEDLFKALGIDENVSAIEDVTVELEKQNDESVDEKEFYVEKTLLHGWVLKSDVAFNNIYTLTIKMTSGKVYKVEVTDVILPEKKPERQRQMQHLEQKER